MQIVQFVRTPRGPEGEQENESLLVHDHLQNSRNWPVGQGKLLRSFSRGSTGPSDGGDTLHQTELRKVENAQSRRL